MHFKTFDQFTFSIFTLLTVCHFGLVQSQFLANIFSSTVGTLTNSFANVVTNVAEVPQSPLTKALCGCSTDQIMEYYGYKTQIHFVTTTDGYILRVFRCISKVPSTKVLLLAHGLVSSSDDFCMNDPTQSLAYVFADAGYDVWLANWRGNFYSKNHTTLSLSDPHFWDFSYWDIGTKDYPAVTDYVLEQTGASKLFFIGHSQGTSAYMAWLSERPEYNQKVAAGSLLAPVSFLGHSGYLYRTLGLIEPVMALFRKSEFLPRSSVNNLAGTFCGMDVTNFCATIMDSLFGPSDDQRNDTMVPIYLCHSGSGASLKQFIHFGQQINYNFFGRYKTGLRIPSNYKLWQITAPTSLHYSPVDKFTNPQDVQTLIPLMSNCLVYVQTVDQSAYNHVDLVWGKSAANDIYKNILEFFAKY